MNPYDSQYDPPDTLPDASQYVSDGPRVASDPDLVSVLEGGYIVEILPVTGGMDVQGMAGVVFFVGVIVLFVILASGIGSNR